MIVQALAAAMPALICKATGPEPFGSGPVFLFRKRLTGKTKKQEKIEKALADQ